MDRKKENEADTFVDKYQNESKKSKEKKLKVRISPPAWVHGKGILDLSRWDFLPKKKLAFPGSLTVIVTEDQYAELRKGILNENGKKVKPLTLEIIKNNIRS